MIAGPLRVLLVEDDPTDALLVREILSEVPEVEIKCISRLVPALEFLKGQGADVVLLDLGLPDSNGLETVRRVVEAAPDVPVIVHTGRAEESAGIEAVHAGAEDYLVKGQADGRALMRTLRHGIERHESKAKMAHLVRVLRAVRHVDQLIVHERDSRRLIERACAMLVETRGYAGAWVALEEGAGLPVHWAQAGWGEKFGPFARMLEDGRWPPCRPTATESRDGIGTFAASSVCEGCPLRVRQGSGLCAVTMLQHTGREFGMLGVAFSDSRAFDEEERELLHELAGDLAFALSGLRTEEEVRRKELQVRARDSQLRGIIANLQDAYFRADLAGRLTAVSPSTARIYGYGSPEEMQGIPAEALYAGAGERDAVIEDLRKDGKISDRVGLGRKKDGTSFWVSLNVQFCRDDEGRIVGTEGFARDISARMRAEEDLRLRDAAIAASSTGVTISDLRGAITYANPAFAQMHDREPGELVGTPLAALWRGRSDELWEEVLRKGLWTGEQEVRRKDGTSLSAQIAINVVKDVRGEPLAVVGAFLDITERKRAEERLRREIADRERMEVELRHLQKLEAVGRLAAGIAHEINTPTQFVWDSLRFLKEAFDAFARLLTGYRAALEASSAAGVGGDSRREEIRALEEALDVEFLEDEIPPSLNRCLDGVSRIATIVQSMREFARSDQRDQSSADINRAIEATITIARNEYKFVANLETAFSELPPVVCHIGDLSQVFLNLIVNAAHAIAEVVKESGAKGTIRISTRHEGEQVRIDVADTGAGIAPDARGHIFEPFFTTKPVGKGTGQGLAIARSIVVDRHGGSLTFESEPGKGTTFTIRLPIGGKANARALSSPSPSPSAPRA